MTLIDLATKICHAIEQRSDDVDVEMRDRVLGCLSEFALDSQRAALAEARKRVIARYEQVDGWLKQPAPYGTLTNWAGMSEGLKQARRIIGAMWDELPVENPYESPAA